MSVKYRDMSVPFTKTELEELKKFYKTLPSYNDKDATISSRDLPAFIEAMRYKSSPEQNLVYQNYWNQNFGGKIPLGKLLLHLQQAHSTSQTFKEMALTFDKNKNGLIDADEFKEVLELLSVYVPATTTLTFDQFIEEADANRDGKVSIQECADWIETHLPTPKV